MSLQDEVYKAADTLRVLANQGLRFAQDGYARERYTQILNVSTHLVAALENRTADEVTAEYEGDFTHMGPHAGVDAAVFRDGQAAPHQASGQRPLGLARRLHRTRRDARRGDQA